MKSGIYKITNTINNKFYIGSAIKFSRRKIQHFSNLRRKKHPNKYLQSSWDKYGESNFIFEIIAYTPEEYLIKLEQWFIDNLKPEYNLCKIAGSTLGIKQPNKFSEETRKHFSEVKKGKKRGKYNKKTTETLIEKEYKIYVKDLQDIIQIFNTYDECSKTLNIPKSTIINALNRHNKVYNTYLFSYNTDFTDNSKYKTNRHKS